jgi:hypothetical protein
VPYPEGPTTADNLAPICKHHHRLKHEGGWTLLKNGAGYVWINPAGIEYIKHPDPIAEPEPKSSPIPKGPSKTSPTVAHTHSSY